MTLKEFHKIVQLSVIFSHKINGTLPLNCTLVAPVTRFYSLNKQK